MMNLENNENSVPQQLIKKKIVLLGNYEVGKTKLVQAILGETFKDKYSPTIGCDTYSKSYVLQPNTTVQMEICDVSGMNRFEPNHFMTNCLNGCSVVALVFDSGEFTIENLQMQIENLSWIPNLPPVVLVGSKIDKYESNQVMLSKTHANINEFIENCNGFFYQNKVFYVSAKNLAVFELTDFIIRENFHTDPTPIQEELFEKFSKVVFIGNQMSGKTSLIKRTIDDTYHDRYKETIGVEFSLKIINFNPNELLKLHIWDIPGREYFNNMLRIYFKEVECFVLVFDVNKSVDCAIDEITGWIEQCKKYSPGVPIVLVGAKKDYPFLNILHWRQLKPKIMEFVSKNADVIYKKPFYVSSDYNIGFGKLMNAIAVDILYNSGSFQVAKKNHKLKKKNRKLKKICDDLHGDIYIDLKSYIEKNDTMAEKNKINLGNFFKAVSSNHFLEKIGAITDINPSLEEMMKILSAELQIFPDDQESYLKKFEGKTIVNYKDFLIQFAKEFIIVSNEETNVETKPENNNLIPLSHREQLLENWMNLICKKIGKKMNKETKLTRNQSTFTFELPHICTITPEEKNAIRSTLKQMVRFDIQIETIKTSVTDLLIIILTNLNNN